MFGPSSTPNLKLISKLWFNLNNYFVGREKESLALLAGIVSREPAILIGPPGTAKTAMIEAIAGAIEGAKVFKYLLTRFTEPDELFGPVDIKALREESVYVRRIEGYLPDANIIFLDEIFKASSAIRNTLLRIMNEREFPNGNKIIKVNWLGFFTASNEISYDEEDQAFYDRLVIRSFVRYVEDSMTVDLLKAGIALEAGELSLPTLSKDVIEMAFAEARERFYAVISNQAVISKYVEALAVLRNNGIVVSDRRKIKVLKVASAISVVYGADTITLDDVADALRFTIVRDESDIAKVEDVIMSVGLMQVTAEVQQVLTMAEELGNIVSRLNDENISLKELKTLLKNGKAIAKKLATTIKRLPRTPRVRAQVAKAMSVLQEFSTTLEKIVEQGV